MLALVAVTVISFGITPAFATSTDRTVSTTADTPKSDYANICNGNNLITRVTPYSNSDGVAVLVDADACSSFSSVTVTLYVEDAWEGAVTTSNDNVTINFTTIGLNVGDDVRAEVTWNY